MAKRPGLHDAFIRIPEETWVRLVKAADRERRSATQQIVWLIDRYLAEHELAGDVPVKRVEETPAPRKGRAKKEK